MFIGIALFVGLVHVCEQNIVTKPLACYTSERDYLTSAIVPILAKQKTRETY
jgi:hypothetical protein